jgi:hypothetical protein
MVGRQSWAFLDCLLDCRLARDCGAYASPFPWTSPPPPAPDLSVSHQLTQSSRCAARLFMSMSAASLAPTNGQGVSCVPPACASASFAQCCALVRGFGLSRSPFFGPFRRRNGRRQAPSPNVLATELDRTAPHPHSLGPTEFRQSVPWPAFVSSICLSAWRGHERLAPSTFWSLS